MSGAISSPPKAGRRRRQVIAQPCPTCDCARYLPADNPVEKSKLENKTANEGPSAVGKRRPQASPVLAANAARADLGISKRLGTRFLGACDRIMNDPSIECSIRRLTNDTLMDQIIAEAGASTAKQPEMPL